MRTLGAILGVLAFLAVICVIIISIGAFMVGWFVPWAIFDYSNGERTGLVNKLSYKGLVCKTYEGYILVGNGQNVQPETFAFTVKDPAVAKEIQDAQGKIATLSYEQYWMSSSCWGDTDYMVTGIKVAQ